jgi:HEAT repeat protein
MKRLALISVLAALGYSANAVTDLETRVIASDGWVAYRVPMVAGADAPCCYVIRDGAATRTRCNLDARSWSFGSDRHDPAAAIDGALAVYLRVELGRIERVYAVSGSCPVQPANTVRWIDPVDPASSIAMLSSLLDRNSAGDPDDHGLVALAYHRGDSATRLLASRAEPSHPRKEREQALFWLGQARGAEGIDVVEHYAATDADPELREHAIFALSQSPSPDAYAHILAIAQRDPAEHVRSEALFWLAEMNDPRARDDISAALRSELSDDVREDAVFALSQLDGGEADDALIAVLHGDYPRSLKKHALFWLGQSGSPRAMAYFDEALK